MRETTTFPTTADTPPQAAHAPFDRHALAHEFGVAEKALQQADISLQDMQQAQTAAQNQNEQSKFDADKRIAADALGKAQEALHEAEAMLRQVISSGAGPDAISRCEADVTKLRSAVQAMKMGGAPAAIAAMLAQVQQMEATVASDETAVSCSTTEAAIAAHIEREEEKREEEKSHGIVVRMAPVPAPHPKRPVVTVEVLVTPKMAIAIAVHKAEVVLKKAIAHGKVVDVQHAALDKARAMHGGKDDDKTWQDARQIQHGASAERLVQHADVVAIGAAVGRDLIADINRNTIAGYLEKFNKDPRNAALIRALDHDHDGKVSIDEFERGMYSVDISYAKIAGLDHDDNWLTGTVNNRSVSEDEFMKAARYIASSMGLVMDSGKTEMIDAHGSKLFDEHHRGRLAIDDIRRVLEQHGHHWANVDTSHDGNVSKAELATAMLEVEVEVHMKGHSAADIAKVFHEMQVHGVTYDKIDKDQDFAQMRQNIEHPVQDVKHTPTEAQKLPNHKPAQHAAALAPAHS